MNGKYIAKFDFNDLAKRGDIVTVIKFGSTMVEFTSPLGKTHYMDKNVFLKNFSPHASR